MGWPVSVAGMREMVSVPKWAKTAFAVIGVSLALGSLLALGSGAFLVSREGDGYLSVTRYGFPLAWRELHPQEVCGQFDCLVGGQYTLNWFFWAIDMVFHTGAAILAFFLYRRIR